jgi:hypothetical protein
MRILPPLSPVFVHGDMVPYWLLADEISFDNEILSPDKK